MSKIQKELALKEKYVQDRTMSRLLECNGDAKQINTCLKRYGASSMTLHEIGLVLDVTRERVRQIESSALKKIKNPRCARKLREYLTL